MSKVQVFSIFSDRNEIKSVFSNVFVLFFLLPIGIAAEVKAYTRTIAIV